MLLCNARLVSVGGTCPSDAGAIYEDTIPKKFSKMALIEQGQWTTAASIKQAKDNAYEAVHHHFG
eukprot:CAMPEP_0180142958 /NCGR_PEP_ID=MMETSP0986-20121125/15933_1 /TAXON_ID=697907 /ORGANISM="non described non described, Strain CCMP2293" /LENGTH=64 /DNA_ID=CAMNT_0022086341 /DNA_START=30 /DNA_END=224 /DNA_ORIENTATION=+